MKRYLPFVLILLVAVGAVTAGTILYRAKLAALTPDASGKAGTPQIGSKEMHVRGNAKAAVTLEEFGDFQCPPCGMLSPVLARIEHELESQLRVVYRHFPLAMHNHAAEAARAAEAA